MKMNKEELKSMAKKSDAELWREITAIASKHGINLTSKTPNHDELERIRRALLGIEKINLGEARRIINEYKNRG